MKTLTGAVRHFPEAMATSISLAKRALRGVGRVALPPRCPGCHVLLADHGGLCPSCWSDMTFIEAPYCPKTGMPLSYDLGEGFVSAEGLLNAPSFDHVRAAVIYKDTARDLVLAMKYNDQPDLAGLIAQQMVRAGRNLIDAADVIVPVPLHPSRLFSRRFNQSAEIAKAISVQTDTPLALEALQRLRPTRQQVKLAYEARLANVEGAFAVPASRMMDVKGRRVLLVDDVITTGATANACSRALLRERAAHIDVLTFAKVVDPEVEPLY